MIRKELLGALLGAGLATLLAQLLDPWAWRHAVLPEIYEHDWGRLFRVFGTLYFWVPLAVAVRLQSGPPSRPLGRPSRAWLLVAGPLLAGGVGEVLKILVRRERPGLHDGAYVFRSFADRPFDTRDIGFPSSHAMVAFAGAAVVARIFPRAAPVAYLLALACGLSRILAHAHFTSDVVAGGIAGWAVASILWRRMVRSADTSIQAPS